jgi:hypothetical protein
VNASANLFDEVVEATGLVSLIAPFAVTRLLISAGLTPKAFTAEELGRALPNFEEGLSVYLKPEELEQALERLRRLATA